MCEQCSADTTTIGTVVPGIILVQAGRDGMEMRAGEYGLVECNDPFIIFSRRPASDNLHGWTEEQIDALAKDSPEWVTQRAWLDAGGEFAEDLQLDPLLGWRIVEACKAAGYDQAVDGGVTHWLYHRMGQLVEGTKIFNPIFEPSVIHPTSLGTITRVWGPAGSGKSTYALKKAGEAQAVGKVVVWVDTTGSFSQEYAATFGFNPGGVEDSVMIQVHSRAEVLTVLKKCTSKADLVVVDGVGSWGSDDDPQEVAETTARNLGLEKFKDDVFAAGTEVLFLCGERTKEGPSSIGGGEVWAVSCHKHIHLPEPIDVTRRVRNWVPTNEPAFLYGNNNHDGNCVNCGKTLGQHYGWRMYRCKPRY